MPGSDASQFTRFKKANAVQNGDNRLTDSKSITRLTQYIPRLTAASSRSEFLSTLTSKSITLITRDDMNFKSTKGESTIPHPNSSNNF